MNEKEKGKIKEKGGKLKENEKRKVKEKGKSWKKGMER